jgi:hypothetical protein
MLYGIGCAAIVEPSISNMGYISTVLTPEQRAKAGPQERRDRQRHRRHRPPGRRQRQYRFRPRRARAT